MSSLETILLQEFTIQESLQLGGVRAQLEMYLYMNEKYPLKEKV